MTQLSLTQQYLLCILTEKGKVSSWDTNGMFCLAAAGVVELLMDGVAVLDNKKLSLQAEQIGRAHV